MVVIFTPKKKSSTSSTTFDAWVDFGVLNQKKSFGTIIPLLKSIPLKLVTAFVKRIDPLPNL